MAERVLGDGAVQDRKETSSEKGSDGGNLAAIELDSMLDSLPETYFRRRAGREEGMVFLSQSIEAITGYAAGELLGSGPGSFGALVHPEDRGELTAEVDRALRSRRSFVHNYRLVHRDGSVRHVCERGRVTRGDHGEPLVEGTLSDETERHWAEQTIHQHTEELAHRAQDRGRILAFLRGINSACEDLLFARQERQVYSAAAEALVGRGQAVFSAIYLVREAMDDAFALTSSPPIVLLDEVARAGRSSSRPQAPGNRPDLSASPVGETVTCGCWTRISPGELPGEKSWRRKLGIRSGVVVPLVFEQTAVGGLLVLRDAPYAGEEIQALELLARHLVAAVISVRRAEQLQQETRQQAELVMRLKEANRDLDAARSMAERANRLKSEFLANMSHEIRTPLSGVLGMAELLEGTHLDPEQQDCVSTVQCCAESLLGLLNEVLDLSKIEAGRIDLDPQKSDLIQIIDTTLETLAARAANKGLVFEAVIDPKLPDHVVIDGGRLRQVLINLVSNAVKFTAEGSVILRASLAPGPAGENELLFSVEDTGVGISPADHSRIFDAFVQVGSDLETRQAGTGLGLAISRQLVRLMGGDLRVDSQPGAGSKFTLQIPLRRSRPEVLEAQSRPLCPGFRGKGVVVLSGERTLSESLAAQLARLGVEFERVDDPRALDESLRRLKRRGVDPLLGLYEDHPSSRELLEAKGLVAVPLVQIACGEGAASQRTSAAAMRIVRPLRFHSLVRCLRTLVGEQEKQKGVDSQADSVRGARVLLVEDDPVSQKLVRRILEGAGAHVEVARNGRRGIEAFIRGRFDVVLMDLRMPVMDGLTATEGIRAWEVEEGIDEPTPILALTADVMKGDREACRQAGMDAHLSKPIRREELFEMIGRWRRRVS